MKDYKLNRTVLFLMAGVIAACLAVASCKRSSSGQRPNILLITVDTMRRDHLGLFGEVAVETPVMNRLAGEGMLFENVTVSAPLTRISHASIFTGLYPPQHGVRDNVSDKLPEEADTLAEILKKKGYRTGAVISGFPVARRSGLNQGFDFFDDSLTDEYFMDRMSKKVSPLPDVKAVQVNDRVIAWLKETSPEDGPWFMWAHYYDPHIPYNPPPPFDLLYKDNPYAGEVAYVDVNVGILLGEVRTLGETKKTLVVLTSDHGEGLGDHEEKTHSWLAYNSTGLVFASFTWPGVIPVGKRITQPVRNIDIFPTMLELAGVRPPRNLPCRSLKPLLAASQAVGDAQEPWAPSYTEALTFMRSMRWFPVYTLLDGRYHYIEMKEPELYDIIDDPREENNLAGTRKKETRQFAARLAKIRDEIEEGPVLKPETTRITEKDRERLRALGYMTDTAPITEGLGPNSEKLDLGQVLMITRWGNQAFELQQAQEYEQAIEIYENIIEKNPDVVETYYSIGKLYYMLGDYERALEYYRTFTARASQSGKAMGLTEQGVVQMAMGEPLEAENLLKEALKLDPDLPLARMNLGMAYGRQNLLEEAEVEFLKSLELDPKFAMAHYGLGVVYLLDRGRQLAAIEKFQQALELDPELALAHVSMGLLLARNEKLMNLPRARYHLEKALQIDPNVEKAELAREILEEIRKK